jgi:hypothetical protein
MRKCITRQRLLALVALCAALSLPAGAAAQFVVETFESYANDATSLTLSSRQFTLTSNIKVRDSVALYTQGGYGYNGSDRWIGSPRGNNSGSLGALQIVPAGFGFEVKSLWAWTSDDGGSNNGTGDVTFTGVLPGGGTVSQTFTVVPGGLSGSDLVQLNFGAAFNGVLLRELQISIANCNFVELDELEYRVAALAADPCAPNPCSNGGSCANDGSGGFTCSCVAGYSGATCATNIDDCSPNPCQNGGSCTDGVNGFTCGCAAGYSGATCATNIDDCSPNPCQNGGSCTDGVNTFTCGCAAGYSGATCATNIDDCSPNP